MPRLLTPLSLLLTLSLALPGSLWADPDAADSNKPSAQKAAANDGPKEKPDSKPAEDKKKASEEKKPEEKKPEGKKPTDDKKPEDKKPTEKKPDEKRPEDKKPDEKKPDEKKPDDKKPDDKKPDDKKPDEKKPEPPKAIAPPVVDPGVTGVPDAVGRAPSDAIVLFDGTNFDAWQGSKPEDPVAWKLIEDERAMQVGKGNLRTREAFGYGHYHLEFRTPAEVKGKGQGRGNSGIFPMGGPEVQVLDSYENETYFDGQCGAIYKQYAPLVNACRPPGVWQTYDIIYVAPPVDSEGKGTGPATLTVLHNGVVIHAAREIKQHRDPKKKGPLQLQDHGNPVQYRNIWYRSHEPAVATAAVAE